MKKSIKLWSIRKLTALGRITVLKTIIIPKLTYLLISLPNPSNKLLNIINDTLFKFIWQNKSDNLKRDLFTQEYQDGGIKMININNFIAVGQVSSECLTCTFIVSCCSARLSRAQVPAFGCKGGGAPALGGTREYEQSDRNR